MNGSPVQNSSVLSGLMLDVLATLGIGLVLLDDKQRVVLWNHWMVKASGLPAEGMLGKTLLETIPLLQGSRIASSIEGVLRRGLPVVLSPALNRVPFPLLCPPSGGGTRAVMQQSIQLMPLRDELGQTYCLIQVQDVTAISLREQALRERAEALRNFAYMDALTGVANRRYFEEELERAWKGSRRNGKSLGLLMVDVDHFKRYNDCLGHQAGDHCLARVAAVLKQALQRPEDMVARYGGEEFAVLLPYTDLAGCREMARRMLALVANLAIPHPESAHGVITVSIGVSCMLNEHDLPADELVRDADVALYRAKLEGRNRISG